MSSYRFRLEDIAYRDHTVINNCSFELERGKTVALIGPSGCGKTTLLNAIAGLKTFTDLSTPQNLRLGYIFQESRLIPWLSIADNLKLVKPDITQDAVLDALDNVRLQEVANKYPIALSGGMQKRVSIARCFATEPELVLLDEPFSSVDTPTAEHLIRLVSAHLQQSKSSAILVTHNLKEALQLADTIYFLSSKPTRIIKTFDVDPSDKNADHHARLILEKYPNILSGRVD